jgi:hypothetical protein
MTTPSSIPPKKPWLSATVTGCGAEGERAQMGEDLV